MNSPVLANEKEFGDPLLLFFFLFFIFIWLFQISVLSRRLSCPEACGNLGTPKGIKLMSPALQGGFLTTGLPGKASPFRLGARARGKAGLGLQVGPLLAYSPGRSW